MKLPFTKMHGLGNDFVVLDCTGGLRPLLAAPSASLMRHLADRRSGVGCDQILMITPPLAADVDFGYRIFNADGTESGQCANGVRCVARYIREHGLSGKDVLGIRTATSRMELYLLADGRVRVDMGAPRFEPADIPLRSAQRRTLYRLELMDGTGVAYGAVGMGNPHAVIEVADVDIAPVAAVGAALQDHPAFPQRVNAGFVQFVDAGHARLRVYERGAGETLACGSGACAAMAVGRLWGRLGARAELALRGGSLELEWDGGTGPVWMTGPAVTVFEGSLEWEL
jgi:diaminopimelate epimerase